MLRCSNHNTHHFSTIMNRIGISRIILWMHNRDDGLSVDVYLTGPNLPLRIQVMKWLRLLLKYSKHPEYNKKQIQSLTCYLVLMNFTTFSSILLYCSDIYHHSHPKTATSQSFHFTYQLQRNDVIFLFLWNGQL